MTDDVKSASTEETPELDAPPADADVAAAEEASAPDPEPSDAERQRDEYYDLFAPQDRRIRQLP